MVHDPAAGDVATAAAWNVLTNDVIDHESRILALAPSGPNWITFTSTIGNGWTLGTGTISAKYIQRGDLVGVVIEFTVGNGTKAAAIPTFTLPVNVATAYLSFAPAFLTDAGTDDWMGQGIVNKAALGDVLGFQYMAIDGAFLKPRSVTSTAPFTWGTGDTMRTSPVFYKTS